MFLWRTLINIASYAQMLHSWEAAKQASWALQPENLSIQPHASPTQHNNTLTRLLSFKKGFITVTTV